MIRGIHHVGLSTPDLDRLTAFYRDVMGFDVVMNTQWRDREIIDRMVGLSGSAARQVMLKAGNAYLELFEYESPVPRPPLTDRNPADHGYTHFCIDVVDIDAEYERLSANGMSFHAPPPTTDELGHTRLRAIYARDPDGNIVELQEVLDADVPFALDRTDLVDFDRAAR
jgi:catechol 2,3-dioxygenase-like lactoylglutathione lyase family enzyme